MPPGIDVMIRIFCNFWQKKWRFLKKQCHDQTSAKTSGSLSKKPIFGQRLLSNLSLKSNPVHATRFLKIFFNLNFLKAKFKKLGWARLGN
jgi:hypothetical protein